MTLKMDDHQSVPSKGLENEEIKDKNEKPHSAIITSSIDNINMITADDADNQDVERRSSSISAVNMAGLVGTELDNNSSHSRASSISMDDMQKPRSAQSMHSNSSSGSFWESDLKIGEDEASFGEDDAAFYEQAGQENNPHIQQTYPIPDQNSKLAMAQGNSSKLNPGKPASFSSSGSRASGASRKSRRGSIRAPGDEYSSYTSNKSLRETDEDRRKREFEERLNRLKKQGSRNRVQQEEKPRRLCCCSKDLLPVTGSLLLLAVGIAVAIYLLFGKGEETAPAPAPTPSRTLSPTIDPNPFRRNLELLIGPPNDETCEAVQHGWSVFGQQWMETIKVVATLDITTYEDIEPMSIILNEIRHDAERRIIPSLVGCLDFEEEVETGHLSTTSATLRTKNRRLQEEASRFRYMIANGKVVDITLKAASSCYESPTMHGPCYRAVIGFQFWYHKQVFSMDALVDELFNDMTTAKMCTGDIISQAQMISVVER